MQDAARQASSVRVQALVFAMDLVTFETVPKEGHAVNTRASLYAGSRTAARADSSGFTCGFRGLLTDESARGRPGADATAV